MTAPDKIWIEPAWAETFARPDGDPAKVAYIPEAIAQAAVAAALEAAANVADEDAASARIGSAVAYRMEDETAIRVARYVIASGLRIADAIRALITQPQHDALAAHVAADVAKARDAALVEAAGTLEVQALDTDAQAKRFRGGSDPWADRTARSRALRNSAAAILALRDKPAPAVTAPITTVQDAARVLLSDADAVLDLSIEIMRNRKPNNGNVMGYQPAVVAALRAIAGGGDE